MERFLSGILLKKKRCVAKKGVSVDNLSKMKSESQLLYFVKVLRRYPTAPRSLRKTQPAATFLQSGLITRRNGGQANRISALL